MARELLNESVRQPSSDLFSLGLTVYELCFTDTSQEPFDVPFDGPEWHRLRDGQYDLPSQRSHRWLDFLRATMAPRAEDRPAALALLSWPELASAGAAADKSSDPLLMSVRARSATEYTPAMNRSPSFDQLSMMG